MYLLKIPLAKDFSRAHKRLPHHDPPPGVVDVDLPRGPVDLAAGAQHQTRRYPLGVPPYPDLRRQPLVPPVDRKIVPRECQARLLQPPKPARIVPAPIPRPLSIKVWKPTGSVEWLLATVWSYDVGRAALEVVAPLYPDREVTLRRDCRVIAK